MGFRTLHPYNNEIPLVNRLKYLLSHKLIVTEAIKHQTCSISNRKIIFTLYALGLSRNLFQIMWNIPTIVGILGSFNSCK